MLRKKRPENAMWLVQQAKRMTLIKLRMIVDGGERIKNCHSNKLYWLLAAEKILLISQIKIYAPWKGETQTANAAACELSATN